LTLESPVFPHLFLCLARVISLSKHLPEDLILAESVILQVLNTS
jgi:hypothetical protein